MVKLVSPVSVSGVINLGRFLNTKEKSEERYSYKEKTQETTDNTKTYFYSNIHASVAKFSSQRTKGQTAMGNNKIQP